jgi:hypothetical protein
MRTRHIRSITQAILLIALLPGCATHRAEMNRGADGKLINISDMAPADPHLDHIIAWIPRDRAQTAAVAEALVHIELGRALDDVGKSLCGGDWLINGASVDSIGPYPSTAPAILGGYPAWYYHTSHEPGLAGCPALPEETLYRELGNRLPPWITVRAASLQVSGQPGTTITATLREHYPLLRRAPGP